MEEHQELCSELKKSLKDKTIVFISGNFNIVHPGHLRLINFARSCGDVLVVGLSTDECAGVIVGFDDRREGLVNLESVDFVTPVGPDDLLAVLEALRPNVVVKGKEHEGFQNPELSIVHAYGGQLIFSSGEATFSSRDLIRRELSNPSAVALQADEEFLARRGTNNARLADLLRQFAGRKVCVIGDLVMDEYVYCDPLGMSQEDPTIVVTPVENRVFVGGAGVVAAHLAGLGADTTFLSVVGSDSMSNLADSTLVKFGVNHHFVVDASRPTTLKQRFRASNKTLLRVSHMRSHDIEKGYQDALFSRFKSAISDAEGVIFSDFNYGCLPQTLVDRATDLCKFKGIPFFADSQASSQVSDVSRFRYADLLAATEREVRLAVNDFRSGLQHVANELLLKSRPNGLILKLGPEGLIALTQKPDYRTDELKAFNVNPVDVAGAGDALLVVAALVRLAGGTIWEASYLGSIAAGVQVSRLGNLPLSANDLSPFLG